ncbi:gamma-glutamyl peptidase 5-like [Macadamia integrifolia]|uniref:gamma-glutamyl peptidase 5-like n=1 Tax=Macadamia integrifolia TaxID=60698 RepID=UPI001C4F2C8B|nr:gamma-glutamyl peptidase 5-like [Macadamia integrifolia]
MEGVGDQKRYALLMAARDSDYVKKVYSGYFNVFKNAFADEGETWEMFSVVDGVFPDMDELHKYDGFVISGSPYDAYGNDPWVLKLCSMLQKLDFMGKKVLGICFGHQVLCRALGGKVERACGGWDLGLRKVSMVEDLPPCGFFDGLKEIPSTLTIIECHQDEVREVPMGAKVIAFSDQTGVEMFNLDHHILGIQGHPEYTKDILCNIIDRLANTNSIKKEFAELVKSRLEIAEPDRKFWLKICKNFLKSPMNLMTDSLS